MADKTMGSGANKPPGGMTKKDAVVRGLTHLGLAATPSQLQAHIKGRYKLNMTLKHISTAKAKILKAGELGPATAPKSPISRPIAQPLASRKVEPVKAPLPQAHGNQGIGLKDIETVKDLLERVGANSLRRLIDVMAR